MVPRRVLRVRRFSLPSPSWEPVWNRPVKVSREYSHLDLTTLFTFPRCTKSICLGGTFSFRLGNFIKTWTLAWRDNFIEIKFRCEECPLLEDEDDISDEEMEQLVSIFPPSWIFFNFQTHRNYGPRWIWTMRNLESQRRRPQWRSRRKDEKSWGYFFKSAIKCLFVCQHTRLVNKQTNRTAKNISNLLKRWCFWRDLEHGSTHTYDAQRAFHISLCWAVNQNPQYLMLSQAMWPGMFWLETASKLFFPSNGLWLTLILHFEILSGSPKVFFKLYCAWLLGHTPLPSSYASLVNFVMGIWEYIGHVKGTFFLWQTMWHCQDFGWYAFPFHH